MSDRTAVEASDEEAGVVYCEAVVDLERSKRANEPGESDNGPDDSSWLDIGAVAGRCELRSPCVLSAVSVDCDPLD
jgi:hypothetical protein